MMNFRSMNVILFILFHLIFSLAKGNSIIFSNEPKIFTKNGFAYIRGCEYYGTDDVTKDSYLTINDTITVQLEGTSKQINKTVSTEIKQQVLNTTNAPTTTTTTSTTTTKVTPPLLTKPTTPKFVLTLPPVTTPKLPFRIGRSLLFFKKLVKEAKKKAKEVVKNVLKDVLVFELPSVFMKHSGFYRCAVKNGNSNPILSSKSDFLSLPDPNVYTNPSFAKEPKKLGGSFSLKGCVIKSNYDLNLANFIWKKDGRTNERANVTGSNGTYQISEKHFYKAQLSDQGFYQCGYADETTGKEILSSKVHVRFQDVSTNLVTIRLEQQWNDELDNTSSTQYKRLSEDIKTQLSESLKTAEITALVEIIKLSPGSIIAETRITYTSVVNNENSNVGCPKSLDENLFAAMDLLSISVKSLDCCPAYTFGDEEIRGTYEVAPTQSMQTLYLPCIYNPSKNLTITCQSNQQKGAKWGEPDMNNCDPKFESTKMLWALQRMKTCTSSRRNNCLDIVTFAERLLETIEKYGINIVEDLLIVTDIVVKNIVNKFDFSNVQKIHKVVPPLFGVLEFVLSEPAHLIGQAEIESGNSNALLKALDRIGYEYLKLASYVERFSLGIPLDIRIDGVNIAFNVEKRQKADTYVIARQNSKKVGIDITSNNITLTKDIISMIKIPSEAIDDDDFIYSYYYRDALLFMEEDSLLRAIGNSTEIKRAVQSNVLSANVGTKTIQNLSNPILLTFRKSDDVNVTKLTGSSSCDYWDFEKATSIPGVKGGWSSVGCKISNLQQHANYFSCECNHLTNFALLLDVSGNTVNLKELSIVVWIGCSLSIAGLTFTVLSFVLFKETRKGVPQKLLLSLSISILILLVMFMTGIERTSDKVGCKIIGAFVHYFLLTSFMWMCVHAVSYYQSFVIVFPSRGADTIFKRSLVAWGVPALIVVVTASVAHEYYVKSKVCMVTGLPFFITVVAPISLILLFNTVVMVIVMKHLHTAIHNKKGSGREKSNIDEVRIGFACNILMGTTWVFGLFAVGDASMVFQWLFCIFNPLQGFFIFIFFTLRNKTITDAWKKFIGFKEDKHSKDLRETNTLKDMHSSTGKSFFYGTKLASTTTDSVSLDSLH